ncbi:phosphopantetheine-binding protein [Staphylococcus warneri]|uniref:phosphopantetheine-binding protein n=1 Tax=Staphylococcus warneri TaxID=1292 RepID=UPI001C254F7B|nr:phosphopantetheine-binding protein [Staphylococcus warneri]MCR1798091.1 phosphopantetheine-binding protein [Staphylococcus warneri]
MISEIIEILKQMGIEEEMNPNTNLLSDLYLDSAELVSLRLELKKKFNVDVSISSDEELTIQELKQKVEREMNDE